MFKRLTFENFKNFKDKVVFDLASPYNYEFSERCIENNCISKAIVCGINGSGKSNLGLAVMDIVCHLTDNQKHLEDYAGYLNLESPKSFAEFEYVFEFNNKELIYTYGKTDVQKLEYEKLIIDGKEYLYYDFQKKDGYTQLPGTETLNENFINESQMSRVKYVAINTIMKDDEITCVFKKFIEFVNKMLLFYSLDRRGYQGFVPPNSKISQTIIETGHLKDFEKFLSENDINYKLCEKEIDGEKKIYCKFNGNKINFFTIASTGTLSLAAFYFWYIYMKQLSFVFIDEFDAFYHFELSISIVKRLIDIKNVQIILTTHNTNLMSNDLLRPDCYFKIKENRINSFSDLTDKDIRKAHNIQKMYKAGAFDGM